MRQLLERYALGLVWVGALAACAWLYVGSTPAGELVGVVEAARTEIAPQVSGQVRAISVNVGDAVTPGQVILEVDDTDLQARIVRLEARRELLEQLIVAGRRSSEFELEERREAVLSEVLRLKRTYREDRATLRRAAAELTGVEREIVRLKGALGHGLVAQRDLNALENQRDGLKVFLAEHRRALDLRMAGVKNAEENADRLEAARPASDNLHTSRLADQILEADSIDDTIAELRAQRRLHAVTTSTGGRVVAVLSHPGDSVQAFQPVIALAPSKSNYADIYIPESAVTTLTQGTRVQLTSPRLLAHPATGTVLALSPDFAPMPARFATMNTPTGQPWARQARVHLDAGHELLPGERVSVSVSTSASTSESAP